MSQIIDFSDKDRTRFYGKINTTTPDACHEWIAWRRKDGYGQLRVGKRFILAHRIAYMLHHNVELPTPSTENGTWVLHHCDNPPCCNPAHLYLGTHKDNMRDKAIRNRVNSTGEANGRALISETDVLDIRRILHEKIERHAQGLGTRRFANLMKAVMQHYGLSHGAVNDILFRRSWKHI